ncbi:MAG: type II toxin-antitoxin system mRNA interferase toxin, RelE/StbE family [Deltaproteobacteria bacterium]|nr:type II toxin-antitoxin system mRNA interferase toxin, RelE/StbE family [Deltaproteobacteria bacterium]
MRTLIWSNTFLRAFKRLLKKQPERREEIQKTLRLLLDNPLNPKLETHKLKGKLSGTWACSAGYDLRILFDFVREKDKKEDDIFLIEIGAHDEVY